MENLQIEIDLTYDYDTEYEFNEQFKHIKGDSYLYIGYGTFSDFFTKSDFFTINSKQITKLKNLIILAKTYNYGSLKDLKGFCHDELIEIYYEIIGYDYLDLDEIEECYIEDNLNYTQNYYTLTLHGNSQGEINQVLINVNEFKASFNEDFNYIDLKEYFTNVFYNPIINGTYTIKFNKEYYIYFEDTKTLVNKDYNFEFDYNDFSKDEYNLSLDIKSIIKYISNNVIGAFKYSEIKSLYKLLNALDYEVIAYV